MEIMTDMKDIINAVEEGVNFIADINDVILENDVDNPYDKVDNVKNDLEYVNKFVESFTDTQNIHNYDILSEKSLGIENIYDTVEAVNNSLIEENIHSENISNQGDYSDYIITNVDKSNNFVDNGDYFSDNNEVIHNKEDFKEINNFIEGLSAKNESAVSSPPNININMGGITQNITEANCDSVLAELSDVLMRALSGCDGVY